MQNSVVWYIKVDHAPVWSVAVSWGALSVADEPVGG